MKHFSILLALLFSTTIGCDSDYTPVLQPGAKEQGQSVVTERTEETTIPQRRIKEKFIRNNSTKPIQIKFNYDTPIIRRLAPGQEINADPLGTGTTPTRLVCEEPYYARTDSNECVTYR